MRCSRGRSQVGGGGREGGREGAVLDSEARHYSAPRSSSSPFRGALLCTDSVVGVGVAGEWCVGGIDDRFVCVSVALGVLLFIVVGRWWISGPGRREEGGVGFW